jgi:hypothetical protein
MTQKPRKDAATRDKETTEYFRSEEFVELVRAAARSSIFNASIKKLKQPYATLRPAFTARRKDMPDIQAAFAKAKEEYTQLNHIRRNRGIGATIGRFMPPVMGQLSFCHTRKDVVVDLKKNRMHRRILQGAFPAFPIDGKDEQTRLALTEPKDPSQCPRLMRQISYM